MESYTKTSANDTRTPPPLGDLTTKALTLLMTAAWQGQPAPLHFRVRGASLEDIRRELVRRETCGTVLR